MMRRTRQHRMEVALILAELPDDRGLLHEVATGANPSELRAAGVWGITELSTVLPLVADQDELVAAHAIVCGGRLISPTNIAQVVRIVGTDDRLSAGIVRHCWPASVTRLQKQSARCRHPARKRQWLLYLLESRGREKCRQLPPAIASELEFFWSHHVENWTNRLDVADQIDFLLSSILVSERMRRGSAIGTHVGASRNGLTARDFLTRMPRGRRCWNVCLGTLVLLIASSDTGSKPTRIPD